MISLLSDLNEHQREVVETTEGPVLVVAGAGSGKTRCIISRVGYLLFEKRIPPTNLLVVTFTNKAARELRDRLEAMSPGSTHSLWVGTFHSIFARILRFEADVLPVNSSFSIYDADDQKALINKIMKEMHLDPKELSAGGVLNLISHCKSSLVRPDDYFRFYRHDAKNDRVAKIYRRYQDALVANNALDFDDILMYTAFLFDEHPSIRDKYAERFRYVMIDEYQDTNYAQFQIIHQIAGEHRNLCAVGDDDQAIYSWRGATIQNILNFEKDYGKVKIVRLEQNYRSTTPILSLANSLIRHNTGRYAKELWSQRASNHLPELASYNGEGEEAEAIIEKLQKLHREGTPWSEMAILYRTNAQSRNYETALLNSSIPFVIVGGVGFYQRREVKDVIAYLRVLQNPSDNESLSRIINVPARKIGDTTVNRLLDDAVLRRVSLYEAVQAADSNPVLRENTKRILRDFVRMIENWRLEKDALPVDELIAKIVTELGLIEIYRKSDDVQDESRAENLEEFIAAAEEFRGQFVEVNDRPPLLEDYLPNLSLLTDLDQNEVGQETLKLMTMHNAKGLEFEQVFVVGLAEDICPHRLCVEPQESLEEERRLLYVAMTRAKNGLYLSYTRWRREFGLIKEGHPSRFLAELDSKWLSGPQAEYMPPLPSRPLAQASKPRREVMLESAKFFQIGQNVVHKTFGRGVILNVDGPDRDAVLTISFSQGALKKIKGSYVEIVE